MTRPALSRKRAPPSTLLHRHPSDHRNSRQSNRHASSHCRRRIPRRKSRSHRRLRRARATSRWGVMKDRTSARSSGEHGVLRAILRIFPALVALEGTMGSCGSPVLLLLLLRLCMRVATLCVIPFLASTLSRPSLPLCRLPPSCLFLQQGCSVLFGMDSAKTVVVSADQPVACFGAVQHLLLP